jgi:hypothetical protein
MDNRMAPHRGAGPKPIGWLSSAHKANQPNDAVSLGQ